MCSYDLCWNMWLSGGQRLNYRATFFLILWDLNFEWKILGTFGPRVSDLWTDRQKFIEFEFWMKFFDKMCLRCVISSGLSSIIQETWGDRGHLQDQGNFNWRMSRRHHDMLTISRLLELCEGNSPVTDGFSSQRTNNAVMICSLLLAEQAFQQTVELPMIWDASTPCGLVQPYDDIDWGQYWLR